VRLWAVALLLTTAFALAPARGAAAAAQPQILARTTYALVAGLPEAREKAQAVAATIDEAAPRIALTVGAQDLSPIPAMIYLDRREFTAATGLPSQTHVAGLATFPPGVIHVDGTEVLATISRVVPHEVAHVLVARALGTAIYALPVWTNEGIAEYAAGSRAAQVDPVSLRAVGRGQSLSIGELDQAIEERGDRSGIAYAEAASIVNFLVDRQGEAVIRELLGSLAQTRDFDESLVDVTGWNAGELERAWRDSVSRRWRWPLLFESPITIYGVMVVLLLAGVVRYCRERRRRRERPEEG
jgi:hypothetical protein